MEAEAGSGADGCVGGDGGAGSGEALVTNHIKSGGRSRSPVGLDKSTQVQALKIVSSSR